SPAQGPGDPAPTASQGFVAGCAAGLGQVLFWSPIELVKLRVQLQTVSSTSPHYLATGAMVRHIVRQEGVAG
ncbi:uncharacterized protein HaLaN_29187, partial [Haematococcus lacustris]